MKEYIKKIVRFISVKPIIGRPVRILVAIVRLPQMRDQINEIKQQQQTYDTVYQLKIDEIKQQQQIDDTSYLLKINEIKQQINEIEHINEIKQQLNEIKQQFKEIEHINEINQQIHEIKQQLQVYDTEYLPSLLESLNYQENLKKSLPVALRQHRRAILNKVSPE